MDNKMNFKFKNFLKDEFAKGEGIEFGENELIGMYCDFYPEYYDDDFDNYYDQSKSIKCIVTGVLMEIEKSPIRILTILVEIMPLEKDAIDIMDYNGAVVPESLLFTDAFNKDNNG